MPVTQWHTKDGNHKVCHSQIHNQHISWCVQPSKAHNDGDHQRIANKGDQREKTVQANGDNFAFMAQII